MLTSPLAAPLLLFALLLALLLFAANVGPILTGAHWVPTPFRTVRRMLRLANVQPGEVVYDLGSGDGRVLIVAAREFGARAVGVEIDPLKYLWTRLVIALLGLGDRVSVRRANFFDADLAGADVVTLYLLPKTQARLLPKLERELKPGARVVTHAFELPDVRPVAEEGEVMVYRLPFEDSPQSTQRA
jgi:cyclopropane fatty-acyl-phospholipid synthase-like methyltransferase